MEYIQYVIVPRKPKMSKGKMASQVAHATFMAIEKQRALVKQAITKEEKETPSCCIENYTGEYPPDKWDTIDKWKETGMCVIVLECKSQVELHGIDKYLEQWEIPHHMYIDEGMTEVLMGTATALATGIIPEDKQWMFKKLKLFRK